MLCGFGAVFSALLQGFRRHHVPGPLEKAVDLMFEPDNFYTPGKDLMKQEIQ